MEEEKKEKKISTSVHIVQFLFAEEPIMQIVAAIYSALEHITFATL